MKQALLFTLLFINVALFAQPSQSTDLVSSAVTIESCNDQENCLTSNDDGYLFYDESKSEFFLKVDFSEFRRGADTNDNWLNRVHDTIFYFRALFPKEQFPPVTDKANRTFRINGRAYYGGVWRDMPVEMSVYPTENSILSVASPNTNLRYDNYKVTFPIPFVPKDFKTYKKLYYNEQTVVITVTQGRINLLKPGMEFLIQDVYNANSR